MTEILELQLEQFNVPDACKRTVVAVLNHVKSTYDFELTEDVMKEVLEYAEQLEARVQDEIEKTRPLEEVEQLPDLTAVPESDVYITQDEGVVNYKGVLYVKLCNEHVAPLEDGVFSHCIKEFGHGNPIHEDELGNTR